jgi:hypothetical protein
LSGAASARAMDVVRCVKVVMNREMVWILEKSFLACFMKQLLHLLEKAGLHSELS